MRERKDGGPVYQVRLHGRGGQGVVTAAELIASAAIADGKYAQAFPSFGSERPGAPLAADRRIDSGRGRIPVERMELDESRFPQPTGEFDVLEADSEVGCGKRLSSNSIRS